MWWALLAGVLQQKMQEKAAREQFESNLRMQRARELDPSIPTYRMQAQQFDNQMDAQSSQAFSQMLGSFLSAPRTQQQEMPSIGQDPGINAAFDAGEGSRSRVLGGRMASDALRRLGGGY